MIDERLDRLTGVAESLAVSVRQHSARIANLLTADETEPEAIAPGEHV
jgi:hypothetical protein